MGLIFVYRMYPQLIAYGIVCLCVCMWNCSSSDSRTDVPYTRVQSVVGIGRGIGLWGDMVVNLDRGDKLEMRAVDDWMDKKKYIEERAEEARAERAQAASGDATVTSRPKAATLQGFGERE